MKTLRIIFILMLIYLSSCSKEVDDNDDITNSPPTITSLTAINNSLLSEESTNIICNANDPDNDDIIYEWEITGGSLNSFNTPSITWYAPKVDVQAEYKITVKVKDSFNDDIDSKEIIITVSPEQHDIFMMKIYPTDDAYVDNLRPEKNYGSELDFCTGKINYGVDGTSDYISYLKFNISDIPHNQPNIWFRKIELVLITGNNNSFEKPTGDVKLYQVPNDSWNEETLNYNNKPEFYYLLTFKDGVRFDVVTEQRFDIESHIEGLVSLNENVFSVAINTINISTTYSWCHFYSKELSVMYSPYIYVEYQIIE